MLANWRSAGRSYGGPLAAGGGRLALRRLARLARLGGRGAGAGAAAGVASGRHAGGGEGTGRPAGAGAWVCRRRGPRWSASRWRTPSGRRTRWRRRGCACAAAGRLRPADAARLQHDRRDRPRDRGGERALSTAVGAMARPRPDHPPGQGQARRTPAVSCRGTRATGRPMPTGCADRWYAMATRRSRHPVARTGHPSARRSASNEGSLSPPRALASRSGTPVANA